MIFKKTLCKPYTEPMANLGALKKPNITVELSIGREDKIRTCDPLNPIQVRYRAAPLPEPLLGQQR